MITNIGLWVVGAALIAVGIGMIRRPLARYQQLEQTEANLRRYEGWRGGSRRTAADTGPTGADVMKQQLRQRVILWGVVIGIGVVLIVVGFAVH